MQGQGIELWQQELSCEELNKYLQDDNFEELLNRSQQLRDLNYRNVITYSKKVFLPLTKLCRDVCHYCTFAKSPRVIEQAYMPVEEAVEIALNGAKLGCKEALFTLGEKPELRYKVALQALENMGFTSTLDYVAHVANKVYESSGLLPHLNVGCMTEEEMIKLRSCCASMGLMLESASERLCEKGMPHYGSPDKHPSRRLETIETAGKLNIPFTTGILVGIGETRKERIDSLLKIKALNDKYHHIQEVIIQNFKPKADTKMHAVKAPSARELCWTIAIARLILGPDISIQAPPNLSPDSMEQIIKAGISDWGGVSPLTPDHVNPEAPWPELEMLSLNTAHAGKLLQERLTIYPEYIMQLEKWSDEAIRPGIYRFSDSQGLARAEQWHAGSELNMSRSTLAQMNADSDQDISPKLKDIIAKCIDRKPITEQEIAYLFASRGAEFTYVCSAADRMRKEIAGESVSYVNNRNINYTNICFYKCKFCAFSKGKVSEELRERPYDMSFPRIVELAQEAWEKGATEVCLQGGIHPKYTGSHYLNVCEAIHTALPDLHIHAFSPLEVFHGAQSLGVSVSSFIKMLKQRGLASLPGTAAEILDDEVRETLCIDKVSSQQWLDIIEAAHQQGLKTTSTIMFGHIERYASWAKHLLAILRLQQRTGGFTEFVPLPFVAQESPMFKRGEARKGPTTREVILMHAVSRLVFAETLPNIQASWVKLGEEGIKACLNAGANDLGGTLMSESITRAAGAKHGQLFSEERMLSIIYEMGRVPVKRNTLYGVINDVFPLNKQVENSLYTFKL
ncbi:5-amino-6-(D-ribitylamino)uracil--L-tyrosine 4-hydroxyphenyl transferase CofH [Pseudoalteromonas sp. OOF1S-7]|uniref:5-amino-6-(D-ribitylamino)uracil--L-tyrosine 4-hydroxyphenyl transferase CofH n=1 Tax=Pseudoalteromonas sp. OOF1S-7 TaxID=2917757 RepID=UPI001EF44F5D|nr:5-amino-6-(D-ribitylamino)uracil--L-tyrosine 4-hydroxyphenyl transferase CofH [Pseudoalteromonas sp. OOF1S-7]MCG7534605.1 5-amino-6-(D-ribitylamino)uracil--L-tyrosine 4-hydroxyphenyl transferase CofH [Pseudoalteromonas sp. OOF1S-7]